MKKILYLLLFCASILDAQDSNESGLSKFKKAPIKFELELSAIIAINQSNKFLANIYEPKIGKKIGIKLSKLNFGYGIDFYDFNSDIKNKNLIGDFKDAKFRYIANYLFYQWGFREQFDLEGKIGFGELSILHRKNNKYINRYNTFILGLGLYRDLDHSGDLRAFIKADYNNVKARSSFEINANELENFNTSYQFIFSLGMGYKF